MKLKVKGILVVFALTVVTMVQASELWWLDADSVDGDGGTTYGKNAILAFANATTSKSGGDRNDGVVFRGENQQDSVVRAQSDLTADFTLSVKSFYVEIYKRELLLGELFVDSAEISASPYALFGFMTSDVVPEPTSGLLVLLGMMLLGLKRKRI